MEDNYGISKLEYSKYYISKNYQTVQSDQQNPAIPKEGKFNRSLL